MIKRVFSIFVYLMKSHLSTRRSVSKVTLCAAKHVRVKLRGRGFYPKLSIPSVFWVLLSEYPSLATKSSSRSEKLRRRARGLPIRRHIALYVIEILPSSMPSHCFLHFTLFIHCVPMYHIIISEMYNNSLKRAIFFGLRLYLRYNRSRTSSRWQSSPSLNFRCS